MGYFVMVMQRGLDRCYWNDRRGWIDDALRATRYYTEKAFAEGVRQSCMHE